MTATEEFNATDDALKEARSRNPRWNLWISRAGRYWATRRGEVRFTKDVDRRWAITVDADSLEVLEGQIKAQNKYEQPYFPFLEYFDELILWIREN